jgi:hypothetical protein
MLVTEVAGTIYAMNTRTIFGDGFCSGPQPTGASSPCILGDFGGSSLLTFHNISAFITVGFYASAGVFALSMPDPEHASTGNDSRATRLRLHKALAWVHLIGMVLQPILGVISYDPGLLGIHDNHYGDVSRDLTMIHMGVGYVTFAALTIAMIDELIH